jgi:hypothetical protein
MNFFATIEDSFAPTPFGPKVLKALLDYVIATL